MQRKVLVTGSNGFIGRHLCRHFAEAGHDVIGVDQFPASEKNTSSRITTIPLVFDEHTDWSDMVADVDAVIHLAAIVHVTPKESMAADYHRINTLLPLSLASQSETAGVRRFLFLSTVGLYGYSASQSLVSETQPPEPRDPYARSKLAAEAALLEHAEKWSMDVAILRTPSVYGPGVKAKLLRLIDFVEKGYPWPFSKTDNRRSFIYLGNLVSALYACFEAEQKINSIYNVSDNHDISTPELVTRIKEGLGTNNLMLNFDGTLLRKIFALLGRPNAMDAIFGSLSVDISKIQKELSWCPPYQLEEGLAETIKWFKSRDVLL